MEYLHITKHTDNGKMTGFYSLSTSPSVNPICATRRTCNGSVCVFCYSNKFEKMYKSLKLCLDDNYRKLQTPLKVNQIPYINTLYFRLESFGDLASCIQFENYILICEANPGVSFALWTKNYGYVNKVLEKRKKPDNLILIQSSPLLNVKEEIRPHFDKVFTVYTKDFAKENNININCDNQCKNCLKCYSLKNKDVYINEILK